jgi:hypothetical protein
VSGAKEFCVALNVLEDVDGDYAVRVERRRELLEISAANFDAGVGLEAATQGVSVGAVRLDEHKLPRSGALKNQVGHSPDSGAGFNGTAADPVRE